MFKNNFVKVLIVLLIAGGMSALGRIEKSNIVRGGGAAIRGLNFQGVK